MMKITPSAHLKPNFWLRSTPLGMMMILVVVVMMKIITIDVHAFCPFETKVSIQVHTPDYKVNDDDDCYGGVDDDENDAFCPFETKVLVQI